MLYGIPWQIPVQGIETVQASQSGVVSIYLYKSFLACSYNYVNSVYQHRRGRYLN